MARRTRRPRVVWLPNTNANSVDAASTNTSTFQKFIHEVVGVLGESVVNLMPVVIDGENDPQAATTSLSDVENSGYRLRRIVGKIFVGCDQEAEDEPSSAICTAGFIILRTRPESGIPLDSADHYDPGRIEQNGDPWIWRRSWFLTNNLSTQDTLRPFSTPAGSNVMRGGVADGPHVDAKTARIVSNEERLFLVCSTQIVQGPTIEGQLPITTRWLTDLRVLASMRTSQGNRRNASR